MGASVTPVPATAPPAGTPVPSAADLASRQTPPTNPPAAPATNPPGGNVDTTRGAAGAGVPQEELERLRSLNAAQEAALRDMHGQNTRLHQQMRDLDGRVKRVENPEPSVDDQNQEFWKNPVGVMNKLIQAELQKTVGPLNERLTRDSSLTAYDRAKLNLKSQYSDIWDKIEPYVDQFVQQATTQGMEVNDQLMNVAALTASGAYYRNQIPGVTPGAPNPNPTPAPAVPPVAPPNPNPAPPTPTSVFTPPHLRPSAPVIPGQEQQQVERRQLTENERRLARERKMTDEQYLDWLEVPPEGVIHTKIGKPEAPK